MLELPLLVAALPFSLLVHGRNEDVTYVGYVVPLLGLHDVVVVMTVQGQTETRFLHLHRLLSVCRLRLVVVLLVVVVVPLLLLVVVVLARRLSQLLVCPLACLVLVFLFRPVSSAVVRQRRQLLLLLVQPRWLRQLPPLLLHRVHLVVAFPCEVTLSRRRRLEHEGRVDVLLLEHL